MKNKIMFVFIVVLSQVVAAEGGESKGEGQWANKDNERVPICECTCELRNEGGGEAAYSSKIWFKATADTKCENNNGAKCDGKQGNVPFAGKTKDCVKSFVKKS